MKRQKLEKLVIIQTYHYTYHEKKDGRFKASNYYINRYDIHRVLAINDTDLNYSIENSNNSYSVFKNKIHGLQQSTI